MELNIAECSNLYCAYSLPVKRCIEKGDGPYSVPFLCLHIPSLSACLVNKISVKGEKCFARSANAVVVSGAGCEKSITCDHNLFAGSECPRPVCGESTARVHAVATVHFMG